MEPVRHPVFLALTRSSRLLGLPFYHGVALLALGAFPFIWLQSLWVGLFVLVVYIGLRFSAEWDDKALEATMKGLAAVPPTQSRKIFGGDSYGP